MTASESVSRTALRDFVDLDFARRLEVAETLAPDHIRALQRFSPDAAAATIAGGTAIYGGAAYPSNQIVGMGLYGAVSSGDIEQLEEFYRSRAVPCRIVVSPLVDTSLLGLLAPRGYGVAEFNSVLIRRLDDIELVEPAAGITVERVNDATAKLWDSIVTQGFAEFGPLPENLFVPFAVLPQTMNFLARAAGDAAGGGMGYVFREAGIAALFGSSTLPQFRGRGVQTALINRRLWEARQAGCEYAVVSTWPGSRSQRNMERRGFRVAYTKVVMARSWPESAEPGRDDGH